MSVAGVTGRCSLVGLRLMPHVLKMRTWTIGNDM